MKLQFREFYLPFPTGYNKKIRMVLPRDYSERGKPHPVLWLLDGQNQYGKNTPFGGWDVITAAEKARPAGSPGFVLVCIDNSRDRDSELTPALGEIISPFGYGFDPLIGDMFSVFVAEKLLPLIRNTTNVSSDPGANAIIGSSSGGLEAFYIGMKYPSLFGKIGALSPAFMFFSEQDWFRWLKPMDLSGSTYPELFIFSGSGEPLEDAILEYVYLMPGWLRSLGYKEKLISYVKPGAPHNESAWRAVLPGVIAALFDKH